MSAFETDMGAAYDYGIESYHGETATARYIADGTTATITIVSNVQVGFEDASQDAFFVVRDDLATDLAIGDEIQYQGRVFQITKANKPGDGTMEIRARAPEERV